MTQWPDLRNVSHLLPSLAAVAATSPFCKRYWDNIAFARVAEFALVMSEFESSVKFVVACIFGKLVALLLPLPQLEDVADLAFTDTL